jgi:hypothetical protein
VPWLRENYPVSLSRWGWNSCFEALWKGGGRENAVAARIENRRKLLHEQEFFRRKIDSEARQEEKQRNKHISREMRKLYQQRKANSEAR